jgi:hypothetical protein
LSFLPSPAWRSSLLASPSTAETVAKEPSPCACGKSVCLRDHKAPLCGCEFCAVVSDSQTEQYNLHHFIYRTIRDMLIAQEMAG